VRIALLGLVLLGAGCHRAPSSAPEAKEVYASTDLYARFRRDPISFAQRFSGKKMTVSGRVVGVDNGKNGRMAILESRDPGGIAVSFLRPEDAQRAVTSNRITATGIVTVGGEMVLFFVLEDSALDAAD
jgi:hypothetical protein